jgi:hypothetical protein
MTPELERQVPAIAIEPNDEGSPSVPPDQVLSTVPAAAPQIVYPWYFAASLAGTPEAVAARLARPPWYDRRPDLGPRLVPFPPELAAILAPPPRWGFFGRSLLHGASDPACGSVYLQSLAEQVLRAHETGRLDEGLVLADRLLTLRPGEEGDALFVESLRLLGRFDTAASFLGSLPRDREATPSVLAVRALLARDLKDPGRASRFAEAAAPWFPGTPLAAVPSNPSAWPRTFAALTRHDEARVEPALPGVGKAR